MTDYTFLADSENIGVRIDKFLSDRIEELTRSSLVNLIADGNIKVNNKLNTFILDSKQRH